MPVKHRNIYWLHSHFLLSTGGTRFIFEVISKLSANYNITIILEKSSPEWKKKYSEIGVNLIEISPLSSNSTIYWLFLPLFLINNLLKLKKLIPKNAIVISSMFPMHFLSTLINRKTIYYCFEPFAFFYDQDLIKSFSKAKQLVLKVLALLFSPLDKHGAKKSILLLGINPSVGKHIQAIYQRKPDAYTYLGVDLRHFHPKVKPLKNKSSNHTTIFHSTDYSTLKGTWYLLHALPLVKNDNSIRILISESVSNKVEKEKYIKYLKNNHLDHLVTFLGHLPYKKLPRAYTFCDIYCFVGSPDSIGATAASLSVLEASAAGMAVIRSIGNTDEVIDGKTGVIIDPRKPAQLAGAIDSLATNVTLRKKMGLAGTKHINRKYTWDKVAKRIASGIDQLNTRTSIDTIAL